MFLLHFLPLFYIGSIVRRTGAQVILAPKEATDSFRCGDSEVLVCSINPYVNLMSWTKNTTVAQLASCTLTLCTTNPSFASEYSFTFNTSSGIFEMTINKVTLADQGTTYFCDNGLDSDSETVDVEVNEDLNVTLSEQQIDSNTTEIRATTGCIKNTTAQNVKWVWWLQEENDTTGEKHYLYQSDSRVYDDSACKADTDCWIDGFTEITIILNITEEGTGKWYNVGINITLGSESFELKRNTTFMLNLPIQEREPSPCSCFEGILIAYFVIWIVQLQMCIYGCSQYSSYLVHGFMGLFKSLQLLTHIPFLGFAPAARIYFSLRKSKKRYIAWHLLLASAPLIGIYVKITLLAWHQLESKLDRPKLKIIFLFAVMVVVSMVLEIFVILLCTVWCISQWYYPFIIAPIDLMSRWVLFIILAVFYHEDIIFKNCRDSTANREDVPDSTANREDVPDSTANREYVPYSTAYRENVSDLNTNRENVPDSKTKRENVPDSKTKRENVPDSNTNRENIQSPLVLGIALWCTPLIGIIFNMYWKYKGYTDDILLGNRVAPKQTNRVAPKKTNRMALGHLIISIRNDRDTSQKKEVEARSLPKLPRVRSRHVLQENTEFYSKLPHIKTA